jgi:UDP-glucose 4-epimerase
VVSANILVCQTEYLGGEVMNIACSKGITVNTLAHKINKILGKDIRAKYLSERKGEVRNSVANIERANKLIGYEPNITFEEGLSKTIEWYKNLSL